MVVASTHQPARLCPTLPARTLTWEIHRSTANPAETTQRHPLPQGRRFRRARRCPRTHRPAILAAGGSRGARWLRRFRVRQYSRGLTSANLQQEITARDRVHTPRSTDFTRHLDILGIYQRLGTTRASISRHCRKSWALCSAECRDRHPPSC